MFNAKDEEIRELTVENNELWQENITLKDKLFEKQQESKQLKEKIDKAIEYIKTCNDEEILNSMFLDESYISNYGAKELLEILGGEDICHVEEEKVKVEDK